MSHTGKKRSRVSRVSRESGKTTCHKHVVILNEVKNLSGNHMKRTKTYLRLYLASTSIAVALVVLQSCYTSPTRVLPPKQIEPLETRIYSAPGTKWSEYRQIRLDLKERGTPEESRNQILEEYLLTEASQLLGKKGYTVVDTGATATLRVYFGVTEKKIESTQTTSVAYGAMSSYSPYVTSFSLLAGFWQAASVSTATWIEQKTDIYYESEISVELYDVESNRQLWRGDVFLPIDSRDIRIGSNFMFRELLWSFPTIAYVSTSVPKAEESEFENLWSSFLNEREFYIPGVRQHISFSFTERRASPEAAEREFKTTAEYQKLKLRERPFERLETTRIYGEAFEKWYNNEGRRSNELEVQEKFRPFTTELPAFIDLLQTSPVAYQAADLSIHLVGEYKISDIRTFIHLIASPVKQEQVYVIGMTKYVRTKYHVTGVRTCNREEFLVITNNAQKQREKAVGKIDDVGSTLTPASAELD